MVMDCTCIVAMNRKNAAEKKMFRTRKITVQNVGTLNLGEGLSSAELSEHCYLALITGHVI